MRIRTDFVTNSSSSSYITIRFWGKKSPKKSFTFDRRDQGFYSVGIKDPREKLNAATTTDEVAGVLEQSFYPFYGQNFLENADFVTLVQEVRETRDIADLGILRAKSRNVVDGFGSAYDLMYDFSKRTGTFEEFEPNEDEF